MTLDIQKYEQELLKQLNNMTSEQRNLDTYDIDQLSTIDVLRAINKQDHSVPLAVQKAIPEISQLVDSVVHAFVNNGRLIYMGAGTSGRLGILDAVECPPTFSVPSSQVVGLIAGGNSAIMKAVEGAEDNPDFGASDLAELNLTANDVVVGIAASGRTPYVMGGLKFANQVGAITAAISCNDQAPIFSVAKISISAVVGPEVLTGSTRMKSGTAQKLILNMITTAAMIRCGKSYQNLMVDVKASNKKLYARAIRIVMQATECDAAEAKSALALCDYEVKVAILMVLTKCTAETARQQLAKTNGHLSEVLA